MRPRFFGNRQSGKHAALRFESSTIDDWQVLPDGWFLLTPLPELCKARAHFNVVTDRFRELKERCPYKRSHCQEECSKFASTRTEFDERFWVPAEKPAFKWQ